MLTQEHLLKEFSEVLERSYPKAYEVLENCHVKVLDFQVVRLGFRCRYIGIYCPSSMLAMVQGYRSIFQEVAEHMGFKEVVCINATPLLRDPGSKLKETAPRFWLELLWIDS